MVDPLFKSMFHVRLTIYDITKTFLARDIIKFTTLKFK